MEKVKQINKGEDDYKLSQSDEILIEDEEE